MYNIEPKIGDKIKISHHGGNSVGTIDRCDKERVHLKSRSFGDVEINRSRVRPLPRPWHGATLEYKSFN